jgi:hypothetical protein
MLTGVHGPADVNIDGTIATENGTIDNHKYRALEYSSSSISSSSSGFSTQELLTLMSMLTGVHWMMVPEMIALSG